MAAACSVSLLDESAFDHRVRHFDDAIFGASRLHLEYLDHPLIVELGLCTQHWRYEADFPVEPAVEFDHKVGRHFHWNLVPFGFELVVQISGVVLSKK